MTDDPLAQLKRAAQRQRGRLKIFFGAAAGVGKTYAMLEAAHARAAEGIDVVVGYVEPHGRAQTEALLTDLELLPFREIAYHGATLREFDLDAALARRPQLILVDELAHSNATGSRHPKRWQDIEELRAAGIDVYTTVNVQHVESLNDVVAQITGVIVRETVPDSVLTGADEVEMIDITPDDLLQRLRAGKIYVPDQAERALASFFRKGNLIALRELALRRTAQRVDAQMEDYRRSNEITALWPAALRLLVGIDSGPAARLIRAAGRMAGELHAEWVVAHVETPAVTRRAAADQERSAALLRMAEQLGATAVTLNGQEAAEELLTYARRHNISKIVIGKPEHPRWYDRMFGSVAEDLMRKSGVIDVYVLSGDFGDTEAPVVDVQTPTTQFRSYGLAALVVVICTVLGYLLDPYLQPINIVMIYLLGVTLVAARLGRGPSALVSLLGVAAFDFFLVPPYLSFAVTDVEYIFTFLTMAAVGLLISDLAARLRAQVAAVRRREERTAALYALSRDLSSARGIEQVLRATMLHVAEVFESRVVVLLPVNERLQPWGAVAGWARETNVEQIFAPGQSDQALAQWVYERGVPAGVGTDTVPAANLLFLPLRGAEGPIGVLGLQPAERVRLGAPDQRHLAENYAGQIALAVERAQLAAEAERSRVAVETERLRTSLLSSVSHDLRTPLAVITGAAGTLLQDGARLDAATRDDLARTALEESERLSRLVANLLDMTRVESGGLIAKKTLVPFDEVVGSAIRRIEPHGETGMLQGRPLALDIPATLPPVPMDETLIEQLLLNLLDNALRYTPAGSPITITARQIAALIEVEVADRGPGLKPGDEEQIFEKFYRASTRRDGAGLGLAICRGIVTAHGGQIRAQNRAGGGASIRFTLPLETSVILRI